MEDQAIYWATKTVRLSELKGLPKNPRKAETAKLLTNFFLLFLKLFYFNILAIKKAPPVGRAAFIKFLQNDNTRPITTKTILYDNARKSNTRHTNKAVIRRSKIRRNGGRCEANRNGVA